MFLSFSAVVVGGGGGGFLSLCIICLRVVDVFTSLRVVICCLFCMLVVVCLSFVEWSVDDCVCCLLSSLSCCLSFCFFDVVYFLAA